MKAGKNTPVLFTVIPGEPWTINGSASQVSTPKDAIAEVLSIAKRFPVRIDVHDGEQTISLEMDKNGRTRPIEAVEDEASTENAISAVVPPMPTQAPLTGATSEQSQEETTGKKRNLKALRVGGIVAAVVVLAAAATIALIGLDKDHKPNDSVDPAANTTASMSATATATGWKIPEGQDVIAVLGKNVITAQGTKVRVLEAVSGSQVGMSYEAQKPSQMRSIEGKTASAFEVDSGRVVVLRGGGAEVIEGVLNARGTEPVIVRDADVSTAAGPKVSFSDKQSVLAANSNSVVLFEGPDTVVLGDKRVTLTAPEPGAVIKQLISATDSRVVVVWSSGSTRLLTTHDIESGSPVLHEGIGSDEVTVRAGIVWVGASKYLAGDLIEPVCAGGEQVSTIIICPVSDGWESTDHTLQFQAKPQVVSEFYSVIDGTVMNVRKKS